MKGSPNALESSISSSDESSIGGSLSSPYPIEITLPEGLQQLVWMQDGEYYTSHYKVMMEVAKRGVKLEDQFIFNLHTSLNRVFIPVYEDGQLVNYVGRLFWWLPFASKLRYCYHEHAKTSHYLFNWDAARYWKQLTLVENTFVGIANQKYHITSNFGSSLSDTQIEKIAKSNADTVVVLWDEVADRNAEKAVNRLRELGVKAIYVKIKGQPDNYPEKTIADMVQQGHKLAKKGRSIFLDAR